MPIGILNAAMATTSARNHDASPAQYAFHRSAPRVTSMQAMGMSATNADAH